jgi:hypothetical protein
VDINQVVQSIGNGGVLVVIAALFILLAYYRETRTIPNMLATFSADAKSTRDTHTEQLRELIIAFENQMKVERETGQKWHEENRRDNSQVLFEMKEQRHYIRDLAHEAGLQRATEKLKNDKEREQ